MGDIVRVVLVVTGLTLCMTAIVAIIEGLGRPSPALPAPSMAPPGAIDYPLGTMVITSPSGNGLNGGAVGIDPVALVEIDPALLAELTIRDQGLFTGRGFLLPRLYDWVIVRDQQDELVLVPLSKGAQLRRFD